MDTILVIFLAILSVALHVDIIDGQCLTSLNLYAETGNKARASTSGGFEFELFCRRDPFTERYDKPLLKDAGDDTYKKKKGHVWSFGLNTKTFCCPSVDALISDVTIDQEHDVVPNAWYVKHAFLYAEIDDTDLALVAVKFDANAWISKTKELELPRNSIEHDNCIAKDQCITTLYVMGDTPGYVAHAGSDTGHSFTINDKTVPLYNLPGDDMEKKKADLWTFTQSGWGLGDPCIKFGDVTYAGFKARGTDAWMIETAIITVQLQSGKYALLAGDVNLNKWVEKERKRPSRSKVPLTLKNEAKDCAAINDYYHY